MIVGVGDQGGADVVADVARGNGQRGRDRTEDGEFHEFQCGGQLLDLRDA